MIEKPCPSFPGYFATDAGRIFTARKRRKLKGRHGGTEVFIDPTYRRERKVFTTPKGYFRVVVVKNGRATATYVHALVLDAFVGPRPLGMQGRHLDGNPQNNTPSNLAWGTFLENAADRARHGRYARGPAHPNYKHGRHSISFKRTEAPR